MEREGSLARKSAILGPIIAIVDQLKSGDREGAMGIIREFLESRRGNVLEAGYQRWRAGLKPEIAKAMADIIQKDPLKEKAARGLFLNSALDELLRTGQAVGKPSSDQ